MTAYISTDQMGTCAGCRNWDDLRMGFCFDCATDGERRAAHRSVVRHLIAGARHVTLRRFTAARIAFSWTWERLTGTGDYAPNGEFEREYGIKR